MLLLLICISLMASSCYNPVPYRRNDLRGYHFGKGNHYNGKYRGARHRYNWEQKH